MKERALSSFSTKHFTNVARFQMIETSFKIFKDYPLFGIGDIDVKEIYLQHAVPIETHEGGHLHNNFAQVLACFGAFGFIAFMLLFVFLFMLLIKNYNFVKSDDNMKILATISIMIFFAFHFSGLFEWNFGDQEIAILLWFSMGLSMLSKKLFLSSLANCDKHNNLNIGRYL
jgi:O-antigen ligase